MTRAYLSPSGFAAAAGAATKWVHNAAAVLDRHIAPTVGEARRLGLARELHMSLAVPLKEADRLAGRALATRGSAHDLVLAATTDSSAVLQLDLQRYLSTFTARLAHARRVVTGKQRGRRARADRDPIAAAGEHGIDIGLLASSLALTPAERLRRLDENAGFLASMRRSRGPGRRR